MPPEATWSTRITMLLVHPSDATLYVAGGGFPVVTMPGRHWQIDEAGMVAALRDVTGVDGLLLRYLPLAAGGAAREERVVAAFAPRDGVAEGQWSADDHGDAHAAALLAELRGKPTHPRRPPWTTRGFQSGIEAWLDDLLAIRGTPRTGATTQIRVWELSYVFVAPTTAGRVFVKAGVDMPLFGNEGMVTAALSALFPGDVPEPIAVDAERRWVVLPDVGDVLGWDAPLDTYADLLRHFARLQIASATHQPELWAAGCLDRRVDWAVDHGTRWIIETDLSAWLSDAEADELRGKLPRLAARAEALAAFGLPDTIVHGDMHPANVAQHPGGFVYFDWTDAAVGHPFVDMIEIHNRDDPTEQDVLRDAYLSEWSAYGPPERVRAAWDAAEPLTFLHHAISFGVIVTSLESPVEASLVRNTAHWLRRLNGALYPEQSRPPGGYRSL